MHSRNMDQENFKSKKTKKNALKKEIAGYVSTYPVGIVGYASAYHVFHVDPPLLKNKTKLIYLSQCCPTASPYCISELKKLSKKEKIVLTLQSKCV